MKKLILLLAALAVTHCTWAVEIYSSNVVGYTRLNLEPGFTLVGNPFQEVGGEDTLKSLQDLMKTEGLLDWEDTFEFFDPELQMWYGTYYYTDAEGILDSDTYEPTDRQVDTGEGFFVRTSSEGATVTFSGEVASATSKSFTIKNGFNLIANPFPVPLNLCTQATTEGFLDWTDTYEYYDPEQQMWFGTYYYTDAEGILDSNTYEPVEELIVPVSGAFFVKHDGAGATLTLSREPAE